MISSVKEGRDNTAMMPFGAILSDSEISAVVDFVRVEFMGGEVVNTRYHTKANGWPNHDRFASAFPFVNGELALDMPWEALTQAQQAGRKLFMSACVTCHDRATVLDEGEFWQRRSVSYPRAGYQPGDSEQRVDTTSAASPYAIHDIAPMLTGLTPEQARGERLFQANCAFCHGADGTGKNWIGSFLASPPRNLTETDFWLTVDKPQLELMIAEGVENTTMPAWKYVLTEEQISDIASYIFRAFVRSSD